MALSSYATLGIVALPLLLAGCSDRAQTGDLPDPVALDMPAAAGAVFPSVAAADGALLVSWMEPDSPGHMLRFAAWEGGRWSSPRTVASGVDWFVNWADFPSVAALADGSLVAHWLQRSGPGRYAYDVLLTRSTDGGATWSAPVRPHRDGTESEHGFVSIFPHAGGAGLVWLDGRQFSSAHGTDNDDHGAGNEMMLRFTTLGADGTLGADDALDARVCDCCQTAAAVTDAGPVVFYRDRSAAEIRDISWTRLVDGRWAEPRTVHADGWHITGCPVNGPQADARGSDVVVAWFTAANDTPRVHVAFSGDAGQSFAAPLRVDDGQPLGRVDVVLLQSGAALVVWLERAAEEAEVRGRLVRAGGAGPSRALAATTAQRTAGFPRMAARGDEVLLAWTVPDSTVRTALLRVR